MSQKLFYICNIVAESEEDYNALLTYLGNYPVYITRKFPEELYFEIPTLAIGWNFIKNKFPNQNIIDKQILKNLFWSFSKSEDDKTFINEVESFFIDSVKKWLPSNFKSYDSYLNQESLEIFINSNINSKKKVFIYFNEGALYINNDNENFIINIKSLTIFDKNYKQTLTDILNKLDVISFSYHNFYSYVNLESLKNIYTIESLRWVKYGVETIDSYFNIIPNFKIQKYIPFLMSRTNLIELDLYEKRFYNRMCERDIITCWLSSREIAFSSTFENSKLDFKIRKKCKLAKINFSNKRTITGRITSKDSYNPQNLNKSNDERKDIISRFENGNIVVFDYITFEPKISVFETENIDFINKYKDIDLYKEIAIILYDTFEISSEQREMAKSIMNPLVYGSSDNSLLAKLIEFKDSEYKLNKIKILLKPIIDKAKIINDLGKKNGYVITPFHSIVKLDKEYAGFNNYIQAYASEIMVNKLFEIKEFLKSYKTEFLFQVHDSLVFDFHPSEDFLIKQITLLLSVFNNMQFGISVHKGPNYKDLSKIVE